MACWVFCPLCVPSPDASGRARAQAEAGRGFAARSLRNMRQFYLAYPMWSAVRTTLTWTSYRILMRLPEAQRSFYEKVAASGRWSSRELEKQINAMLYERAALSRKPDELLAAIPKEETSTAARDVFDEDFYIDLVFLHRMLRKPNKT
jgi:hypothetical protein